MTIIVLKGYLNVPETELQQVLDALPEHKQLTLQEPGCLEFRVDQNREDPNRFDVYEKFTDREAFEYHQKRITESNWGKITIDVARKFKVFEKA